MGPLRRRRANLLIARAQPFADEPLVAVANFTWVGNSIGAQPGARGRADWAPGLPDWTLIGAGATTLFVVETEHLRSDHGKALYGRWPLRQMEMTPQRHQRSIGPIPLGAWRAVRFEFPDRGPAVLQPFGNEVDALLDAHRAARQAPEVDLTGMRWDDLTEVALLTTGRGPFDEDVFFKLTYADGTSEAIGLGDSDHLLPQLQRLPGFDNETFVAAMGVSDDSLSVLWRR